MRKKIAMGLMAALITATALTGCSSNNDGKETPTTAPTGSITAPTGTTTAPTGTTTAPDGTATAHTGYYIKTSVSSSAAASADKNGKVQVDSTLVYLTVDSEGKVTKAGIDAAQTSIPFDIAGQIPADFDLTALQKTKLEKGTEYGMAKASAIGKEWNEQANGFADWAVGKSLTDVLGVKTKEVDDSHKQVPDEADLASTVTLDLGAWLEGIDAASKNLLLGGGLTGNYKTGMGVVTSVAKSKSAAAEAAGVGQVDCVIAIVSIDENGKIVQLKFDNAQTKVEFNADGTIKSDLTAPVLSKQELKEGYGMIKASAIGKEWYQQADAFAEWCIGKSLDEVKGIKTKKVDDGHPMVPDEAELTSSVTITVNDYIAALEKAVANAK